MIEDEFQCRDCGVVTLVARESVHDDVVPPVMCLSCGSSRFKRLFARAGIIFNGDGWACKS